MTEVAQALSEVRDLYAKFIGQRAPEVGPGWFAPFPPGIDPVRFAIQEVDELKRIIAQARAIPASAAWIPRADVEAEEHALVIRLEVPGVGREQLKVLVAEGECIVRGERPAPKPEGQRRPIGVELPYGAFERRFPLPTHAEADKLTAKYADGILELRIPIAEISPPKEMKVEVK